METYARLTGVARLFEAVTRVVAHASEKVESCAFANKNTSPTTFGCSLTVIDLLQPHNQKIMSKAHFGA